MKTRKVKLYADLYPGWHDYPTKDLFVSAFSNPASNDTPKNGLRVEIEVELPCIEPKHESDFQVKGEVNP